MARNPAELEAERVRAEITAGLAQANRLVADGRNREALAICRRLHDQAPRHPEVLGLLGLLYARTGELNKALTYLAEALLYSQRNPRVLYSLAQVYLQAGTPIHALHSLRSYRAERTQLILGQEQMPDPDALMARLAAFMREEPGIAELPTEVGDRAMMAAERGRLRLLFDEDPEKAMPDLREAMRLAPHYPQPRNNLSLAYFYNGQAAQARAMLETTLREVQPGNVYALATLAFVRWAAGEAPGAVAPLVAEAADRLTPHSRLLDRTRVAEVAGALGDHERAYAALADVQPAGADAGEAPADSTEHAAASRLRAIALANLGRVDEAANLLRTAPTLAVDPLARRLLLAFEAGETLPALASGGYPYLAWEDLLSLHVLRRVVSPPPSARFGFRPPPPTPDQAAARLAELCPRLPLVGALLLWMGEPLLESLGLALLSLVETPETDALLDAHLRGTAGSYSGRQQAGYALLDVGRLPNGVAIPFWMGTEWGEIRLFRLSPQSRKRAALQETIQTLVGRLAESRVP